MPAFSEGVLDPITATVLALDSGDTQVVMVSCDLVGISDDLRDAVRGRLRGVLPEVDTHAVFLNATHTHTAPEVRSDRDIRSIVDVDVPSMGKVELEIMPAAEYITFAAGRIVEAVMQAWAGRTPGGMGFGLGHAVVGHNRRVSYHTGESCMYGKTDDPQFSHIEGYEDHSVNVLAFYDQQQRLTGIIVNLACPSQVSEQLFQLSADYWHETREELHRRLGPEVFVLAQCSAAGDQSPHLLLGRETEERMWRLAGRTQRQEIAVRIADAVTAILPLVKQEVDWHPILQHRAEILPLPYRPLTEQDVNDALTEAAHLREQYEALRQDLEAHPDKSHEPRWYVPMTAAYRRMQWNEGVAERFQRQQTDPMLPVEVHALRLGDVAIATNPFEYYLDFGMQIKARSRAVQTFVVQLAGSGTYLPTFRATAGRSYGAIPASTPIGPEGGRKLADWTIQALNAFWE